MNRGVKNDNHPHYPYQYSPTPKALHQATTKTSRFDVEFSPQILSYRQIFNKSAGQTTSMISIQERLHD